MKKKFLEIVKIRYLVIRICFLIAKLIQVLEYGTQKSNRIYGFTRNDMDYHFNPSE
jgi:hypothetical protein